MTRLDEIKKKMLELEEETPNWKDTTVYVAGFMDGAMWADEHPHWISVEDELPPRWETNPNVSVPVITFGTLGESSIPFVELQRYDFGGSKWQYGDATHWILFQFPEKGGEK